MKCAATFPDNTKCQRPVTQTGNCKTHSVIRNFREVFTSSIFHLFKDITVNRPSKLISYGICSTYPDIQRCVRGFVQEFKVECVEFKDYLSSTVCNQVSPAVLVFNRNCVLSECDEDTYLYQLYFPGADIVRSYLLRQTGEVVHISSNAVTHESKQELWNILVQKNVRFPYLVLVFDLEWSQHVFAERFKSGFIVDHHFEVLGENLVVSSGLLNCPGTLSKFILDQGYSPESIKDAPSFISMPLALDKLNDVCDRVTFMAYNGKSSDLHVLESAGILVKEYVDATSMLNPHGFFTQAEIYQGAFGRPPDIIHWASGDTIALLDILKHRGVSAGKVRTFLDMYNTLNTDLSCKQLLRFRGPCKQPRHKNICCFDCN